jgi:hypothetical protein
MKKGNQKKEEKEMVLGLKEREREVERERESLLSLCHSLALLRLCKV